MTSDGFGEADPPAGMHRLFALAPDRCAIAHLCSAIYAFLQPWFYVPIWFMEHDRNSPEPEALPANVGRRDGWTPFARRLFLEVLAETGGSAAPANMRS